MLLFSKKLEKLQFLSFVLFFIVPCRVVLFRKTYWKQAKYGPCTQKGNCRHPSNYRLISLTSYIVSALFEKIISSHMMKHLEHAMWSTTQLLPTQVMWNPIGLSDTWIDDKFWQKHSVWFSNNGFYKGLQHWPHQGFLYKLRWYGIWGNIY